MSIVFFGIAVLAGVLTILAPCILPLLPVIIGSADPDEKRTISTRSLVVIGSLLVSVMIFTLLLKATTLFIDIPPVFWQYFSGLIIIIVGLALLFPHIWSRIPFIASINKTSNSALGKGFQKKNYLGDSLMGVALGPVFTTCSPTYLFIIATILPLSFIIGFVYLIGFTIGLGISLLIIAYFGQSIIQKISSQSKKLEWIKKIFAFLILIAGILIITGLDKKIETVILDSGYGATIQFEEGLIRRLQPESNIGNNQSAIRNNNTSISIPRNLRQEFQHTDWSNVDERIESVVSGGPGKDGIPSIDNPKFTSPEEFMYSDDIYALILEDNGAHKAYPYNILTWHEIVNDTVGGKKIAITFCPLCGSAIAFSRIVNDQELEFGVSGYLRESNMIMYDRQTESLWQQSTGEAFAGEMYGHSLEYMPFQLMTIKNAKDRYDNLVILSDNTGYNRNYGRNPYSGYENNNRFIFPPSSQNDRFNQKDIFVVFKVEDISVGFPWLELENNTTTEMTIGDRAITISKADNELHIYDKQGIIPFYFEMWFSFYAQHGDDGLVIEVVE